MIVAVSGGKGGVGRSTVAFNLGVELEAVVVDADLSMADLPHGHGPDLHDVLTDRADPLEAVREVGSVRLLPCGRSLAGARAADLTGLPRVLERLEQEFGRVVLDSPSGIGRDVHVGFHAADCSVLVTTAAEEAIADTLRTKTIGLERDAPIGAVVLNRQKECARRVRELEDTFGASVVAVPESETVRIAWYLGRPVREIDPGDDAAIRLSELSKTIERCDPGRSNRFGVGGRIG